MRQDPVHGWRRLRRCKATAGRLACVILLVAGEIAVTATAMGVASGPAQAQFFPFGGGGDSYQRDRDYHQRPPRPRQPVQGYQRQQQQPGWFGIPGFGWGGDQRIPDYEREQPQPRRTRPAHVEPTRPPAPPKKPDIEPTTHVVVIGDTMSEWLASGLEDAFADTPDIGVTRNPKIASSLLRNEGRDADPLQAIQEALAGEKAEFIVMMTGVNDRHPIREREKPKAAEKKSNDSEQPAVTAPEHEKPGAMQTYEFRSDKWAELYAKRIDDTIAVLKTKRVPVIWVGLPPVRGPRSRADLTFLNDLYKDRAEKAGILYVDIWDGFMEESGDFSTYGPDVLGQVRRLRTSDGVNFTKAGARKLAHFVDREIKRLQQKATPVALPAPDETPREVGPTVPGGPAPRPVAGPVVPLTGGPATNESALAGASKTNPSEDTAAARVLVKGEAIPSAHGRADDFSWTPVSASAAQQDIAPLPEPAAPPAATRATPPTPARAAPAPQPQRAKPAPPRRSNPQQQRSAVQPSPVPDRPAR